jgi:hypothetical protein
VQRLDTPDQQDVDTGRHRAPSGGRRLVVRIAMLVGALGATAALGLVAANALGVTDLATGSGHASTQGSSDVLPLDPQFEKTVDIHPPASRAERPAPSTTVPQPVIQRPAAPSPAATPSAAARPAAEQSPQPRPAPAVRLGKRCSDTGASATTADGRRVVCVSGRGGRARWRLA